MRRSVTFTILAGSTLLLGSQALAPASARAPEPRTARVAAAAVNTCPVGATYGSPLPSSTLAATLVRSGYSFLEGPVWVASRGTLLMSDLQPGTGSQNVQPAAIRSFAPPSTFGTLVPASGSNGLAITPDGSGILAATQDQRAVSSFSLADLSRTTVASRYQGRRFNSPNDLTVRSDGTVYFTDPSFQRGRRSDEMSGVTGVYRVRNGTVSRVDANVRQPNGIALSPDERTLYVGANGENRIYRYAVQADGSVRNRTTFATMSGPDGVTVDCAGNVYWASYNDGKVHVFNPAGVEIGTISAGANTTNAAFGGSDRRTLYITSGSQGNFGLYSVNLAVPGNPY